MLLILSDWDRQWALALDPEARPGPGCAMDAEAAVSVLSRLVLDAAHRDGIRRALATGYPRGLRPLPADIPALRLELESRLRNREWMLFAGPSRPALKGGGGRSVPRWEAQPGPETEELVPLFDPEPPERAAAERAAVAWGLAEVVVGAAEAEPVEAQPGPAAEAAWEVASVVADGEEAEPAAADPESPGPGGAWELESVAVADEEVVPEAAGPEADARESEGGWDVVGVVVEGEEVLPEG